MNMNNNFKKEKFKKEKLKKEKLSKEKPKKDKYKKEKFNDSKFNSNTKRNNKYDNKNNKKQYDKNVVQKETIVAECIALNNDGKGIIIHNDNKIFVPNLLEGETATIEIITKNNETIANVLKIKKSSPKRVKPKCPYYKECGGCQLQHMSYEAQTEYKQKIVGKVLKPYGKVNDIITMEEPYDYRNKIHATYSYGSKRKIVSGFYEEKSHRVIPIERCVIQNPIADEINASIRELMKSFKMKPYDEDKRDGFLRHVLIKTGYKTNEVMVVLVTSSIIFPSKNNFVKALLKKHPEITTIIMNVNDRKTSVVLGEREKTIYGKGTIKDVLCGSTFNISSKSFYQVNPIQTEKLYNKAIEMAQFKGNETVIDTYCGIGTIGIILSDKVKSVIGVEVNKDAVKDAILNANINKRKNIRFYNDDAGEFMMKMTQSGQKIDTVIMDPPRSGSDEKFLSSLVKLSPKKVVYISCNPITQARDLKTLTTNGYKVEEIQPVDMFPQTGHVETVVLITRK